MNPPDLFSTTYTECRSRFLDAAATAGYTVDSMVHPLKGPAGETLAMDFASGGAPDADTGLVIISGTHGPEGYTGSACQSGFLLSPELQALFSEHRVVLVHGHNPFGFAWMRRTNEDNIDLNRNYIDFTQPCPTNPGYSELHEAFVPDDLGDEGAEASLKAYQEEHGTMAYMAAMIGGQHQHANGLFYGGVAPSWSREQMVTGLRSQLAAQRRVVVIDIHTGLGPYGVPYLVHGYPKSDPRFGEMKSAFGDVMRSTAVQEEFDEDLPTSPEGPIVLAMDWILPDKENYAYVIEYGTFPPDQVLGAHREDNWLHARGDLNSERGKAIKAELRRVMYPEFDDWKSSIWEHAVWAWGRSAAVLANK
jgi:hypothetical protein